MRGVPYVAYDYISGKTLAQVLEQSAKKHSPVPLDHALLMTERIALGLAVAYETRIGDERVQHGFLTPHLVIVSNEGELRLLGFEASSGLREAANHPLIKQSAGRYLAPEVLAGAAPAKSDDVYSLGAILFELLTGRALPVSTAGGQAALVDQAVIAADGGNLHPELANLLKRSLVAREQRIGDAVTWHKTLAKMMFEGQYNPTTFNLAFFMHNLFREEIERETQELELEKTTAIPVPSQAAAPAAPKAAAPSFGQSGGAPARDTPVREETLGGRERQAMESKPEKNNTMLIAAGVGGLIVLGGVGYFMFGRGSATPSSPGVADAPLSAAPADTGGAPAGPTPEEIQAQIQKIVDDKIKSSSAQYEEQLKTLQKQLDDAKKAQEARAAAAAAPRPVTAPPSAAPATTTAPPPAVSAGGGGSGGSAHREHDGSGTTGGRTDPRRGRAQARRAGRDRGGPRPGGDGARHRPRRRPRHDGGRRHSAEGRPARQPALPAARPAHEEGGDRHRPRSGRRDRAGRRRPGDRPRRRFRNGRGGDGVRPRFRLHSGDQGRRAGEDVDGPQGRIQPDRRLIAAARRAGSARATHASPARVGNSRANKRGALAGASFRPAVVRRSYRSAALMLATSC